MAERIKRIGTSRTARWHIAPWDHPLRWFLRSRNVLNLLAMGALVVSVGAAATVIGIAEVQIGSSKGGSADLWGNSWFVVGLIVGSIGLVCLTLALSSNGAQTRARHEFPDLLFAIVSQKQKPGPEPDPRKTWLDVFPDEMGPHELGECGIRVTNQETNRYASLEFTLVCDTEEGDRGFLPPFAERMPWTIAPGMSDRRIVTFQLPSYISIKGGTCRIEIVDHNSGRRIRFPNTHGPHPRSTWQLL